MALVFPGVESILMMLIKPLIMNRAKAFAKMIFARLKSRGDEKALADELVHTIETGQVDSFIEKYHKSIPKDVTEKIRSLANLRENLTKAEKIINAQKYSPDAANVFIDLAKILDDVMFGVSFEEAGVKDVTVQDEETNDKIRVTSEEYLVALLLRYAAAVWTQVATMSTPSGRGWTLEYGAKIDVTLGRPQIQKELMSAPAPSMGARAADVAGEAEAKKEKAFEEGFLEFRGAYEKLIDFYRSGLAIRDQFLNAVSCLKSAQYKVKRIRKDKQEMTHRYMDPNHLEGLVLGFRAEAQFWVFRISDELAQSASTAKNFFEEDAKQVKEWLNFMDVSKKEFKEFLDALTLYRNFPEGLAGALKLYKEASEKCIPGKDQDAINKRINELQSVSSNKATVSVPDPKPIM